MNFGRLCKKKLLSEEDLLKEYGRTWIWIALDPLSRLIICFFIGDRTLESCKKFVNDLVSRIKGKPLFTSDELPHYKEALLEGYHTKVESEKTSKRGRHMKVKKEIDPEIDYATVHKERVNNKIVNVKRKIIYGIPERIEECLLNSSVSNTINTSFIERANGTLRQHDSHLHRKTYAFAKANQYLCAKFPIIVVYYNFVKPHYSLSKNTDKSITPRTPAQVAGITKTPWTWNFLLFCPSL